MQKKQAALKYIGSICPTTQKKVELVKLQAMQCHITSGGGNSFEMEHHDNTYIVDLEKRPCGC